MMTRARTAWTLVETMVVLAVTAALLGIMLPVLSKSIAASRAAACLAATASYARATHIYAGDARDLPPAAPVVGRGGPGSSQLPLVQLPTPGGRRLVEYPYQGWFSVLGLVHGEYLPAQAALCPTQARLAGTEGTEMGVFGADESRRPNYAIPEVFYLRPEAYSDPARIVDEAAALRVQRLSDVRHPARKVLVFEYRVWHLPDSPKIIPALRSGRTGSISTTDGAARAWRLAGELPRGTNAVWGYQRPSPWITPDGVRGADLP